MNRFKIRTFTLVTCILLFTTCGKKADDGVDPSKVTKEITATELLDYQILEEFDINPEYIQQYGEKPRLYVYAIKQGPAADVFHLIMNSGTTQVIRKVIYNAETDHTTIETDYGHIELTRDNNKNIIVTKGFQFRNTNDGKEIRSKYTQIVKTNNEAFNNKSFKAVEGINGYYRFSESLKWMYLATTPAAEYELTWDYKQATNTIWYGKDSGTAKYNNRFIMIPKGHGWKGQYKDKDLLLVHTWDNGGKVISNLAVCIELSNPSEVDVYIAGEDGSVAKFWKNGVSNILDGNSARSIFVSKNNVYVAGSSNSKAVYWRNNSKTILLGLNASAHQIFVNGNDIYLAGSASSLAVSWKNGETNSLRRTNELWQSSTASSIYVFGHDIHIASSENFPTKSISLHWKNGEAHKVSQDKENLHTDAKDLYVYEDDVYMVGYEGLTAKLWKNGIGTNLTDGTKNAEALGIYVYENDIYIVGYEGKIAKLWKNGTATNLTDASTYAAAEDVFVYENDIYVVGYEGKIAKLWKNGSSTNLTNGIDDARARSIFIVPKY